jgi:phytoene dehydrogenase-like protein
MSGWTGIIKATRSGHERRAPHAVLFGSPYTEEFVDIFDRDRPPQTPTIYQCAQSRSHLRPHWGEHEPLFVMTNAPPEPLRQASPQEWWDRNRQYVHDQLTSAGLIHAEDLIVWERTPSGLASTFQGSRGSIYGAASNDMFAAFRRPPNKVPGIRGLYVASGGAHPGGGLPLCALSGRAAAHAILASSSRALV